MRSLGTRARLPSPPRPPSARHGPTPTPHRTLSRPELAATCRPECPVTMPYKSQSATACDAHAAPSRPSAGRCVGRAHRPLCTRPATASQTRGDGASPHTLLLGQVCGRAADALELCARDSLSARHVLIICRLETRPLGQNPEHNFRPFTHGSACRSLRHGRRRTARRMADGAREGPPREATALSRRPNPGGMGKDRCGQHCRWPAAKGPDSLAAPPLDQAGVCARGRPVPVQRVLKSGVQLREVRR